jgi:hypothetical protein
MADASVVRTAPECPRKTPPQPVTRWTDSAPEELLVQRNPTVPFAALTSLAGS